jgi:hypothetical protein
MKVGQGAALFFTEVGDGRPAPVPLFIIPPPDLAPNADPRVIAARLVEEEDRFSHLRHGEAQIMFLFRSVPKIKGGKRTLGYIALPRFQGALGDVAGWLLETACDGIYPDYIMVLDGEFWTEARTIQREYLVFHELAHTLHETDAEGELKFTDEGRPVFGLQAHDIEEFNDAVEKYGAALPDIQRFVDAAARGGVKPRG